MGFLDMEGLSYYNQKLNSDIEKKLGIQTVLMDQADYENLDEESKMKNILYLVSISNASEPISIPQTMESDTFVEVDTSGADNWNSVEIETFPGTSSNKTDVDPIVSSFDIFYKSRKRR